MQWRNIESAPFEQVVLVTDGVNIALGAKARPDPFDEAEEDEWWASCGWIDPSQPSSGCELYTPHSQPRTKPTGWLPLDAIDALPEE